MNGDFFEALNLLEKEKGVPADYLLEKIKNAVIIAVKKDYANPEIINISVDKEKQKFKVSISKKVVSEVTNPANEILLEEALHHSKRAMLDEVVEIKLDTKQFGRIAAQTAKQVIRQGIREAEREMVLEEFQSKLHDIVTAVVEKIDYKRGMITLEIGKNQAVLPKSEQIAGEELMVGQRILVYVVDVTNTEKGPKIMISRTHPGLVKRLFEREVPEIYDGTVEIKAVAREAGSRTKLAVYSKDENVDAVGACIGNRGSRVNVIVDELRGEKIDVINYSENSSEFIAAALSPADVVSVEEIEGEAKSCRVRVPDSQLSLAIGNKGQNVRLAVRLTGYKIDIRPESGYFGEEQA